ncbi:hypothetical protein NP493_1177g00003 [Ridgeia piscesae]|uniref:Uridine kinase n=1 Tax=Ridgeia piscesae TaxID=27915 RepID=A0AAD9NGZ7_RIDPI|nr:hypothetical protein NP493_1177g00003 [Ridgeia piscesae]
MDEECIDVVCCSGSGSGEDRDEVRGDDMLSTEPVPRSPIRAAQCSAKRRSRTISSSSSATQARIVRSGSRTIYTAGRPPWYDSRGQLREPFVIGISGGSASGKTTVAKRIIETLNVQWVSLLSMDSFYKVLSEKDHELAANAEYNFDHPDAFDFDLLRITLQRLKEGKNVEVPIYNFATHRREKHQKTIYGANVVIFEGILAFAKKDMLPLMDMKIFVDTDSDIRLARRLKRDIMERDREMVSVIKQYNKFVKPAFEHYIQPTMVYADIIVPRGGENEIAVNLIVNHVHQQLVQRGFQFRSKLNESAHEGQPLPDTLHLLPTTHQIKGLHTFVRDKTISRDEFIFYSKRLMRLLIEFALSLLPFKNVAVETPQGITYNGKRLDARKVCRKFDEVVQILICFHSINRSLLMTCD